MLLLMIVVMMLSQGMHTLLKDWVFPVKYFSTWLYRYCSILGIYCFYLSNRYLLYNVCAARFSLFGYSCKC